MNSVSKRIAAIIIVVMVVAIAVYGVMPKAEKKQKLHVVINEFYPRKQGDPRPGWIELYNPTDEIINITYWKFWYSGIYGYLQPCQYGLHYIYPHEYLLLGNETLIRKYWDVPDNVRIVEMPPIAEPTSTSPPPFCISLRIEARSSPEECGKTVDEIPRKRPSLPPGHSWARYRGEYGADNFTANFYEEPNPTSGYENHRVKGKESQGKELYLFTGLIAAGGAVAAVTALYYLKGMRKKNKKHK